MQEANATLNQLSLNDVNLMSKIFGSLFYYPLTHENNQTIIEIIEGSEDIEQNGFNDFIKAVESEGNEAINEDFFLLFEGGEVMVAPPWGSVYLDKEQVIFGDSTLRYRRFLKQHDIELDTGMREPEDQFGLMLLAVSQIIERHEDLSLVEALFAEHLLPWCTRYLSLVEQHAKTASYRYLAVLVNEWCVGIQQALNITPTALKVYR